MLKKFDAYDGMSFFGGLCFFAPVSLLVRTQAGISESAFFLLQALLSVTIFLSEVPTGMLGDRIGYKHSLVLSAVLQLAARALLLMAFLFQSPALFIVEAIVEGVSCTFSSGTGEAYTYEVYGKEKYLSKAAQLGNCGTAGFILSTISYVFIYRAFGIAGLIIATVLAHVVVVACALALPKEKAHSQGERPASAGLADLMLILRQKQALVLMALSSLFSITGILINFFYAEKLIACGADIQLMSPIILVYSLIQMLAKPILDRLKHLPRGKVLGVTCIIAALVLMAFGVVNHAIPVMGMMVLLPLLLSLPGFFLGEQENDFIDSFARGENRAASLSVMNMGVSLVEIAALFASAILTGASVGLCFLGVGGVLLAFGIAFGCARGAAAGLRAGS